jgi:hypothetical protein
MMYSDGDETTGDENAVEPATEEVTEAGADSADEAAAE